VNDGKRELRARFWVETAAATAAVVLGAVTLVWKEWIEVVFDVDPDQGSGALEWAIVAVFAIVALALFFAARQEWRRPSLAPG
jgi:hypothetical protein